jgi:hypothetical protein
MKAAGSRSEDAKGVVEWGYLDVVKERDESRVGGECQSTRISCQSCRSENSFTCKAERQPFFKASTSR